MALNHYKTILKGQAAIDLWLRGLDFWNRWVEDNPVADVSFAGVDFTRFESVSFEGYIFPKGEVNFHAAQFGEGDVSFHRVKFGEGNVIFSEAKFGEGNVDFSKSQFDKGNVNFYKSQFGKGNISFRRTKFGEGYVKFSETRFGKGYVSFRLVQFGVGNIDFSNSLFGEGNLNFTGADFGEGDVSFYRVQFGNGSVIFSGTKFGKGDVGFNAAKFGEGNVTFCHTHFGKGCISFNEAKFSEGSVNFAFADFCEGNVSFRLSQFGEGNTSFNRTQFGRGEVSFFKAQFGKGNVNFSGAKFGEGDVCFDKTQFSESKVNFKYIKLSGQFNFSNAKGTEHINFLSFKFATFDGPVNLVNTNFNCIVDLTNTKLSHQLSLGRFNARAKVKTRSKLILKIFIRIQKLWFGSQLQFSRTKKTLKKCDRLSRQFPWLSKATAANRSDIERIRRLKELAEMNEHHRLALDLHVEELKCSRWIETISKRALFVEFLFDKFGDYGRSLQRPFVGLVAIGALCSPIYYFSRVERAATITDALYYSFAQMLHLIPSSKTSRIEFATRLFGSTDKIPDYLFLLSWFQSLASIALVFLIGLALRNRFRI